MKKTAIITVIILLAVSGYVFADNATGDGGNVLILYYSKTGKTRIVAEKLNALMPDSKLVEVKSDVSIPAAIFWYKFPFTKADIELPNIDYDDYDKIFLCTPVYLQGISPPIKAVIRDVPLKGKKTAVFAVCGGFYGSLMQGFVKRSIRSRGGEAQGVYVVKVGGKVDVEIQEQVAIHLNTVFSAE